jgi:hypothetical protein
MLVSESPHVFQVDVGANGYYDVFRWVPRQSIPHVVRRSLNLSVGFGRINTAVCVRAL